MTPPQNQADDAAELEESLSEGEALLSELPPIEHKPGHRAPRLFDMSRPVAFLCLGLVGIILGLIGYLAYLTHTANSWRDRAGELELTAQSLGQQIGQLRDELTITKQTLSHTSEQLETAKARINELADEKARSDDDRAAQQQLIAIQQRISLKASQVTATYDQCVQGQVALLGYQQQLDQYDLTDVQNFADRVLGICDYASQTHEELLQMLEELDS